MIRNLDEIELIFYQVIKREIKISEFEDWLYNTDEEVIDQYFGEGFYFKLVDLNYKDKNVLDNLDKILHDRIQFGKFEKEKIMGVLKSIIDKPTDLVESLETCYDLYCDGYTFLRIPALSYVLYELDQVPGLTNKSKWHMFRFNSKRKIVQKIYPKIKDEARRICTFLESGAIVITGEFEYQDARAKEDQKEKEFY